MNPLYENNTDTCRPSSRSSRRRREQTPEQNLELEQVQEECEFDLVQEYRAEKVALTKMSSTESLKKKKSSFMSKFQNQFKRKHLF